MKDLAARLRFAPYSEHEWRMAVLLFISYVAVSVLASHFVPAGIILAPAAGVALGGLFFGWPRLWPVVLVAALISGYLSGTAPLPTVMLAISVTVQSACGAYLLRKAKLDPLFRRYRDTFTLVFTVLLVSLITPFLNTFWNTTLYLPHTLVEWGQSYASTIFCLLIVTPFVLRWCAKVRFSRGWKEILETLAVFGLLIGIDAAIYANGITLIFGIRLIYFLFIPLFWIALRLRPRFITLALVITSLFAISSVLDTSSAELLAPALFQTETLLITLSTIFLVIGALEEDRRLNTNLMRSQLATLENAVARISTESKAKNDFIAVLAHELRNPLAPIMSSIDLMKIKKDRDAEDRETLAIMDDRMKTVRRLLDDLLDVSRISEGKITINKARVDLENVIRNALLSTAHHTKERHQVVITKGIAKGFFVEGDSTRLEQIFSNLLTNASKYSNSGDQITLTMQKKDGCAVVTVADQGVGIESKEAEHIFTPFHQVGSGARTQKGLGIGLALVKSFVQAHGGSVVAESSGRGKGSAFVVTIPLST